MKTEKQRKKVINDVMQARSHRFIKCISEMYPELDEDPLTRIRVATMVEVIQYCSLGTQIILSSVNRYFCKLIQTARISVSVNCRAEWVDSLNKSPFISDVALYDECDNNEMDRFCRIIRNDGFLFLRSIAVHLLSEENIVSIIEALDDKVSRTLRLGLVSSEDAFSLTLQCFYLTTRICYAFSEASMNGLNRALASLQITTNDVEGVLNFFKLVDFSTFTLLRRLVLSDCPLQTRGFEVLVRSLWPSGKSNVCSAPIHDLILDNTQLHDSNIRSLQSIMERGLLADLENLNLSSNCITIEGIRHLTEALSQYSCPNLKHLILSDNYLSANSTVAFFNALAQGVCPLLSQIELSNTGIGPEDIRSFALYLRSPYPENLTRINISNNPLITEALSVFFEALLHSNCKKIKTLLMENISISVTEIRILTQWLVSGKATSLCHLLLRSNLLDQNSFCLLLAALITGQCPRLSVLDFSGNLIGNFDETQWTNLLNTPGSPIAFEQLDFSFNPLTDTDMSFIIQYMKQYSNVDSIQRIGFSNNLITAETLYLFFEAFPNHPCALYYLNFSSCSFTECGQYFYTFMCSEAARNLDLLCLQDCNLSEKDLSVLCDALIDGDCVKLRYLKLDGNANLQDSFVTRFLDVLQKGTVPNLSIISLGFTAITYRGLMMFLDYIRMNPFSHIQEIYVNGIDVSKSEKKDLKEKFDQEFSGLFTI